jgi:hypothetical protein
VRRTDGLLIANQATREDPGVPLQSGRARVLRRCAIATSTAWLVAALSTAGSSTARAQGNDRSAPTGGRSALMGNTGVALARDGAAPFLNPATIVSIEDKHLAFSVNFFTYSLRRVSDWNEPGAVDSRFGALKLQSTGETSTRFHALPSTLCLFFTLSKVTLLDSESEESAPPRGRQKLALCVGSLEADDINLTALQFQGGTSAGSTSQIESIARSWNRLYVGPTYGVELTDRLALGMSLHGVVTSDSFVVAGTNISSLTDGTALQSALGNAAYGYSFDLAAILGATYRAGSLTLGASAQLPALHILGRYQANASDEVSGTDGTGTVMSGTGTFRALPPVRLAVGAGVQWPRLTVEVDESYDLPAPEAVVTDLQGTRTTLAGTTATTSPLTVQYAVGTHSTFNTAVGAEYFLTRGLSILGGASTNLSMLGTLTPSTALGNPVQARTNHVSASFGIGSYGGIGDLLMGMQLDYGWGQLLAVDPYVVPNQWTAIATQTYSAMFVLAGATNLRAIGRAVEKVENAVTNGVPASPAPPKAP